jgi:cell fate (sporulation/competence/biofilm development) regulator YlbF (YheA/YmcA/DUF963 family)
MEPIWERAREVGRQIAHSSEYGAMKRASETLQNDREAVTRLNRLQQLEAGFARAMQGGSEPPLEEQDEYERLVGEVQTIPAYQAFEAARASLDQLMARVNEEIEKGIQAGEQSRIILA